MRHVSIPATFVPDAILSHAERVIHIALRKSKGETMATSSSRSAITPMGKRRSPLPSLSLSQDILLHCTASFVSFFFPVRHFLSSIRLYRERVSAEPSTAFACKQGGCMNIQKGGRTIPSRFYGTWIGSLKTYFDSYKRRNENVRAK